MPGVDIYADHPLPVVFLVDEESHCMLILPVEVFLIAHLPVIALDQEKIVHKGYSDYFLVIRIPVHHKFTLAVLHQSGGMQLREHARY